MAVTSIWPINRNPKVVIDYARNPEKTVDRVADDMASLHTIGDVIDYAADEMKTETRAYVSYINIEDIENVAQEFMEVKEFWGQMEGRQCFHGYQSFKADEVDAETAHNIGVELATKLWGEDFQVVVATHCNTGHYHNHFVINSVSLTDGHHFHNGPEDYQAMRNMSDELCQKYRLSVIENPEGRGKNYAEYEAEQQGKPTIRSMIRDDLDRAVNASITRTEFLKFLEDSGYEMKLYKQNGELLEYPALKPPGAKGFFRFHKLGPGYSLEALERKVYKNLQRKEPLPVEERTQLQQYRNDNPPPLYERKKSHLYRLYLRYCYELHIIETHPASVSRVSFLMREDIARLDRLDAETRLLGKNKISTYEDLAAYREGLLLDISALEDRRQTLRYEVKRSNRKGDLKTVDESKKQISLISKQIRELRKEVGLCDDIAIRSAQTREELEWLLDHQENYQWKEEKTDELFRGGSRASRPNELAGG